MINGEAAPPTYDGNLQVTITFTQTQTLNNWQILLNVLANGPWNVANPMIGEIQRQVQEKLANTPPIETRPEARQ